MGSRASAWWRAHRPTGRRLIQVYAALLYNANLKGFVNGEIYQGSVKSICVPGFNCYSCPGAIGACPLGALQNALASSGNRAPFYVLGLLGLFGLALGRVICGWLCPMGLVQELLYKLPTPKLRKGRITRALTWFKYILLAVFVIAIPLIYSLQRFPVPAFCKYICPAGTLEGAMALLANPVNAPHFSMLNILFTRKFIIMVAILTTCAFVYRAFCRFLCPLGAIYGLFAKVALLGVKVDDKRCTHCGRCTAHCKMDVRRVGDHECIHCGSCMDVCPTKAISLRCGKWTLKANDVGRAPAKPSQGSCAAACMPKANETSRASAKPSRRWRAIAWTLALLVLAGALWYFQVDQPDAAPPPVAVVDDTPVGSEVGMRCPDFTVPRYGGGDFSPVAGKVNVINFWATWCTPCVGELPHFERLYETYGDQIALVAIHSNLVTDDVEAFLDSEGYALPFALDTDGSVIASLGGSAMLPMTVIVDQGGKIVYNRVGSITYESLDGLVSPLLAGS